jgi:4-amino-4-deoxy-L-arabinose transferase-like glycosyltransferase
MRRPDRRLWVVLGVALVVRLVVALSWAPAVEADAADYDRLAVALSQGQGYVGPDGQPTAWRPPLYPGLMAAVYAVAGHRPVAVRVVQAVVGTALVGAVYLLGQAVLGPTAGLLAAAFTAVDLASVFAVSRLLSEALFSLLLVLSSLLVVWAAAASPGSRRGRILGLAAGVTVALGALTRGVFLLYPLALVPVWIWAGRDRRVMGAFLVGFVLALVPWTVRNQAVMHAFVPVATQGGATLYAGNRPVDGWILGFVPDDAQTRQAALLPEPEASSHLVGATARALLDDPAAVPWLTVLKSAYFWVPLDWEILPWYGAFNPTYAFLLLWTAVGAVWALGRADRREALRSAWPLWLPVAYMFALALVFYGSPRFRLPVEPLFALGAAAGLLRLRASSGARRTWTLALVSVVVVAALAVIAGPAKAVVRGLLAS